MVVVVSMVCVDTTGNKRQDPQWPYNEPSQFGTLSADPRAHPHQEPSTPGPTLYFKGNSGNLVTKETSKP